MNEVVNEDLCQGCVYTLSSFICLTEDQTSILRFLWNHGCLRKKYFCEKCGRQCTIGDKDLFFRCNKNIIENPETNGKDAIQVFDFLNDNLEPLLVGNWTEISNEQTLAIREEGHCSILQASPEKKSKVAQKITGKRRCNFKMSMKRGTFFERSKLPLNTVCKFIAYWCCLRNPTQEFLRNELSMSARTVVDWSTACRDICSKWACKNSQKVGGDGILVYIDEILVKTDPDDGQRFMVWGMEKINEMGRIFVVPVSIHNSYTLLSVISDWVLPGSVIVSNCWKSYDCLKQPEYMQYAVSCSQTFVSPSTNNQLLDGKFEENLQIPRFGSRRSHYLGDLSEYLFKRRFSNHLERVHNFFVEVARNFPLA